MAYPNTIEICKIPAYYATEDLGVNVHHCMDDPRYVWGWRDVGYESPRDWILWVRIPSWVSGYRIDAYGPRVSLVIGDASQRLRWIPPGSFLMGSPPKEIGVYRDERPQHEVCLTRGFWLAETPCTQALWQTVTGQQNRSAFQGLRHPVESVSWEDCQEFLKRLNTRIYGLEACLPTEAEWEYACRAGVQAARYHAILDTIAWYDENSDASTQPVGLQMPNAWGLYDTLGNVWEWCQDGYRDYTRGNIINPVGAMDDGVSRAIRGGSWGSSERVAHAAYRYFLPPTSRLHSVGFRLAISG